MTEKKGSRESETGQGRGRKEQVAVKNAEYRKPVAGSYPGIQGSAYLYRKSTIMQRVIGLGGPFIKAKDPKAMVAWYEKHLGLDFKGQVYTDWSFANADGSAKPGYNVLSFFKEDSDYFAPSEKQVMLNFVVQDVFGLMNVLKEEGVTIIGEPMDEVYGKFIWILDPEGNKIELWEPPQA